MDNQLSNLPNLGVGITYQRTFAKEIIHYYDRIDFLELTTENHLVVNNKSQQKELSLLSQLFPLVLHGVELSIGSVVGIESAYINQLSALIDYIKPVWISDHICFTRARDIEIGHLTPLPFTEESLDVLCHNINQLKQLISVPCLFENIAYLFTWPINEMTEVEFFSALADRTRTGLLLDLTNLYANCLNHDVDPFEFIDTYPLTHIIELHIAGGEWYQKKYIDSHSRKVPEHVWQLLEITLKKTSVKGIILERTGAKAPLGELVEELERARELQHKYMKR